MAIDMSTVKNIKFNNKQIKKIEDSNGNTMWEWEAVPTMFFTGEYSVKLKNVNNVSKYMYANNNTVTSKSNHITKFMFLTENQLKALVDYDNIVISGGDVYYNNSNIGTFDPGSGTINVPSPNHNNPLTIQNFYLCFINNNQLYVIGGQMPTNTLVNEGDMFQVTYDLASNVFNSNFTGLKLRHAGVGDTGYYIYYSNALETVSVSLSDNNGASEQLYWKSSSVIELSVSYGLSSSSPHPLP